MKIVVIGGGAAGFFAAIHAAQTGADVTLLEKSNKVLAKVKVSGGGRCNVTNSCIDPVQLIRNYPRGSKELLGPFTRFGPSQTIEWFEERNVQLKTEQDGRIFPVTNSSQTIIDCLLSAAASSNVKIKYSTGVENITRQEDVFDITLTGGATIVADKVIVATGGNAVAKNYDWLRLAGHTIFAPVPSLFTFNVPDNPMNDLMGISVQDCIIKISGTKLEQQGPLLFTHWGVSGPAILKLSAWGARYCHANNYDFSISINFLPRSNQQTLRDEMILKIKNNPSGKIMTSMLNEIPSRLLERLCGLAGILKQQTWNDAGKSSINKLISNLTALQLSVKGKTTFKEEFVTCGGISLKEINMKTMESKLVPGLYFAGEVLDIDGVTGGFNFQAAWTTGYLAGINVGI